MKMTTHLHLVLRFKNEWRFTSTPKYVFMAWCLINHTCYTALDAFCVNLDLLTPLKKYDFSFNSVAENLVQ